MKRWRGTLAMAAKTRGSRTPLARIWDSVISCRSRAWSPSIGGPPLSIGAGEIGQDLSLGAAGHAGLARPGFFIVERDNPDRGHRLGLDPGLAGLVAAPGRPNEAAFVFDDVLEGGVIGRVPDVRFEKGPGLGQQSGLDLVEERGDTGPERGQRHGFLGSRIAADEHGLAGLDIAGTDLDPEGHAPHLVFGELPPRGHFFAGIDDGPEAGLSEPFGDGFGGREHRFPPLADRNGHDHDLDWSDAGRKTQAGIVAVDHDQGADRPGRHAPGGLPDVLERLTAVLELDVKGLREVLT